MPAHTIDHAGLGEPLALMQQAMNAGDADVRDYFYFVAHDFGRPLRLFENRRSLVPAQIMAILPLP